MRYLILNADDFGYSEVVNAAVIRAHREGVLTSASLMVAEPGFVQASVLAQEYPTLGVGLHLVVTNDRAVLSKQEIPHLVNAEGRFEANPFRAGIRYAFSKKIQAELKREMEAQFARFAETGLDWSHVDGHQHFHMPPVVWDTLLELCDRHGVYRLRLPNEPIRPHLKAGGGGPDLNTVAALVFRLLRRRNLRRLREYEGSEAITFFTCDRVYGHLQTGSMNADYTLKLLERLDGDTNEIYFHPGAPHARLLPPEKRRNGIADVELEALLSPAVRQKIEDLGLYCGTYAEINAANYRDLVE